MKPLILRLLLLFLLIGVSLITFPCLGKPLPLLAATAPPVYITQWGTQGSGNGQLANPTDVVADSSGNIYITDFSNQRIQKFTNNGVYLGQWGAAGTDLGQFNNPAGVAIDSQGNLYVADQSNGRIQKFTSNGVYLMQWNSWMHLGTVYEQFSAPTDVAVDNNDNVYVADFWNHRIVKFTSNGVYLAKWGTQGSGNGQFNQPVGLAADSAGNIYVADYSNHRIQKFTSSGAYLTQWGVQGNGNGQFYYPVGVAIDSHGNSYVTDGYSRVQVFDSNGAYLTQWGEQGNGNGQFADSPFGLAVDSTGNIYVADRGNARIQKFGWLPDTATITIIHDALPDSATNFRFSGGLGAFYLDDITPQDGDAYRNSKEFTVAPGVYNVAEVLPSTWVLAGIVCNPAAKGTVNLSLKRVTLRVVAGDNVTCTFTNHFKATVNTLVFHDLNQNRVYNSGEPGLSGWTVSVYDSNHIQLFTGVTDVAGKANFVRQLAPNVTYKVCVDVTPGWTRTVPTTLDLVLNKPCYSTTPTPGQVVTLRFGNKPLAVEAAEETVTELVEDVTSEEAPALAPDESGYDAGYVEAEEETTPPPADQSTPAQTQLLFLPLISNNTP